MPTRKRSYYKCTLGTIWGLAKAPELQLDSEEVHLIVLRETGKESMKKLTQKEIGLICEVLGRQKDKAMGVGNKGGKRTDVNGNAGTQWQRKKIYALTEELEWNNNNNRINGFCKRMFKIDRLEWLDYVQCSVMIEALKKMIDRKNEL